MDDRDGNVTTGKTSMRIREASRIIFVALPSFAPRSIPDIFRVFPECFEGMSPWVRIAGSSYLDRAILEGSIVVFHPLLCFRTWNRLSMNYTVRG
jgi:hypothetical protein